MHLLATLGPDWLYHPLGVCVHGPTYVACRSYNFFSGIGSDFGELTLLGTFITILLLAYHWWRHHECSEQTCHHIALRKLTAAGDPVCRRHAPKGHHNKPHEQILADHHKAKEST